MGNSMQEDAKNPSKKDPKFLSNLQLYQELVTEEFGHIRVFKLNEKPFGYYMLYRETGINEQKTRLRLQEKLNWYSHLKQHRNIASIEYVDLQPTQDMCIQRINLDIYAKYYNYTLDMAVALKLKRSLKFREGDLAYILLSLLSVGKSFNQMVAGQYSGWFDIKNVYITPEGHVKLYPFPINCQLKPGSGIHRIIESPYKNSKSSIQNDEILLHLSRKTSDGNNSAPTVARNKLTEKEDIKDIGLIILQLLILNRETVQVKLYSNQKIQFTFNLLGREGHINSFFKDILIRLVCGYKQVRYQQVIDGIESLYEEKKISISHSIKLDEGSSIIESNIYEKNENLKQLSEHKQLKAGCITILSSRKKNNSQRQ